MRNHTFNSLTALCAVIAMAGPAWADCQQELAELQGQMGATGQDGIAKDGSLAPLEGESSGESASADSSSDMSGSTSETQSAAGEGEIAKDGSETPLDTDTANVATSGQQAEDQQNDVSTALAEKGPETVPQEVEAALARAETALAAGDEAGCMEAVEEAKRL